MISGDRSLASGKMGAYFNTLGELRKHFERIDIICPHVSVVRYDMSVFGNVYVHPSPWPLVLQWFWILHKGRQLIRRFGHQSMTVHEYSPVFNGVGARWLHRRTGVPYMLEVMHVTGLPRPSGIWERLNLLLLRAFVARDARDASVVRVINEHETPEFLVSAGIARTKIRSIPAFYIDTDTFTPMTDVPKQYDIAFVGRMARNKGLNLFLDVIERTERIGVAVGDGPMLGWARQQSKRRSLKIHFPGFAHDSGEVARYINASRILLMPSYSEGGPRVVLEAMACGVPVIATPVGIVRDVLPPEAIEEWDAPALADKVKNILTDTTLYERLRGGGLQTAKAFEKTVMVQRYADAIKNMVHHE